MAPARSDFFDSFYHRGDEPPVELGELRSGACLADLLTNLGRLAADLRLDAVEFTDAGERFASDGRVGGHVDVVELSARRAPNRPPL